MRTITSEDIQRYARIVIYMIVGALGQRGIQIDGTWIDIAGFALGGAANLAWSVHGMRINAKIIELNKLAKIPETSVAGLIMTNTTEGRILASTLRGPIEVAGSAGAKSLAA